MISPSSPPTADDGIADARALPTRRIYDPREERLTIVVDVHPATRDECRVHAGPEAIRITLEHADGATATRTISPPSRRDVFTDERRAVYNNGVLEITVGVAQRDGWNRLRLSSELGSIV